MFFSLEETIVDHDGWILPSLDQYIAVYCTHQFKCDRMFTTCYIGTEYTEYCNRGWQQGQANLSQWMPKSKWTKWCGLQLRTLCDKLCVQSKWQGNSDFRSNLRTLKRLRRTCSQRVETVLNASVKHALAGWKTFDVEPQHSYTCHVSYKAFVCKRKTCNFTLKSKKSPCSFSTFSFSDGIFLGLLLFSTVVRETALLGAPELALPTAWQVTQVTYHVQVHHMYNCKFDQVVSREACSDFLTSTFAPHSTNSTASSPWNVRGHQIAYCPYGKQVNVSECNVKTVTDF